MSSPQPLRAAVVGCGAIAYEHLDHLQRCSNAQLVATCDASPVAARFAADRFGATHCFTDLDAMLSATQPDVVHVLTPPHTHEPLALSCLAAGAHVLCEKPAAPDAASLERMLTAARAANRQLMESQNLRWNDPVLAVTAARRDGWLGEVREVDLLLSLDLAGGRFGDENLSGPGVRLPGGAVHDFLPHLAYVFLTATGSDDLLPAAHDIVVRGVLENLTGNARVGCDHLDALVTWAGVRGRLRVAPDLRPDAFRLVVRGTRGAVETDLYHPYVRREGGPNTGKRVALEHAKSGLSLAATGFTNLHDQVRRHDVYHGLGRMVNAVYANLVGGIDLPVSPGQMRASAHLVDRLVALGATP